MRKQARCCCGRCWHRHFQLLLLWRWTDDLRLYAWAQFFPFLALVLIRRLFPPRCGAVCARQITGDVISENLSLDAGSRTPAVHRVLSPVSSTMSSAFPKERMGRLPAFCPHELRLLAGPCFEDADIP